jgi:glutamate 5-kinase
VPTAPGAAVIPTFYAGDAAEASDSSSADTFDAAAVAAAAATTATAAVTTSFEAGEKSALGRGGIRPKVVAACAAVQGGVAAVVIGR